MTSRRLCLAVAIAALAPISRSIAQTTPNFRTLASFTGPGFTGGPKPSPDGRFLLISTSNEIRVYETATGQTRKLADGTGGEFAWSPRGDRIAWVRGGDDGTGEYVWTMPIDPRTAAASGPAQRVSMGQGEFPAISFDGQWIAYSAADTDGPGSWNGLLPHRLSVVRVTGGPERVLAHFPQGAGAIHWSVDGKSIYLAAGVNGKRGVVKVAADGRQPPQLVREGAEFVVGMTASRRHIILVPAKAMVAPGDRAVVIDTSGKEVARIPLPVGTQISYNGVLGDSAIVWIEAASQRRVQIQSMTGGPAKLVPLVAESNTAPVWSPDGKQIAFQLVRNRRTHAAVMNADGTNVHVFDDTDVRLNPGLKWSPDSKYVGFVDASGYRFTTVDVATRKTSTFAVGDSTTHMGVWTWHPGGRSITTVMIGQSVPRRVSVHEIQLGGTRRQLVDVGDAAAQAWFVFLDPWKAIYRADSTASVIDLRNGSRRRLSAVPPATIVFGPTASPDRRWVGGPLWDSKRPANDQFELLSLETNERKVLELPFRITMQSQSGFHPDGGSLLLFGRPGNDTAFTHLYSVPLNGGAPRSIARMPNTPYGGSVSASPDGKAVAYSFQASSTMSLLLVDIRGASARMASTPTRR